MKNRLLLAMLALILSASGYTWIARSFENPGSMAISTSPGVPARSSDWRDEPQFMNTVPAKEPEQASEAGMPVASERITLKSEIDGGEYRSLASRAGNSDASGYFEFSGLGGIDHTLGVYANGYKPHIVYHQLQSFSDHLEIRLRR